MSLWRNVTIGFTSEQLSEFDAFVAEVDPRGYEDEDRLHALRATFAMRHGQQFEGIWELGDGNRRRLRRRAPYTATMRPTISVL